MPEGDSVLRAARRLHAALAGRVLLRSDFRVPRFATADLTGSTVLDVTPRGKHLLARCSDGTTVHSHLRMDGAWHTFAVGDPWRGGPNWQIRVVLANDAHVAVGYRLPVLELVRTADEARAVGHLGPDVLGPDWDLDRVVIAALADPEREIGAVLLDQTVLAGLGNIYRMEACFLAGVTPWTPVGELADAARLIGRAQQLIKANADRPERMPFWVYGRGGRPCRRCATVVLAAGPADDRERETQWCPHCQRGPAPTPVRSPGRSPSPSSGSPRSVRRGRARPGGRGHG